MSIHTKPQLSRSSKPTDLPEVILNYIASANDGRINDATTCFGENARVRDENRDYQGIDAIRDWIAETTESSQPQNEVISVKSDGETLVVHSKIIGNFPGSPVELEFQYVLNNGKISNLSIQ